MQVMKGVGILLMTVMSFEVYADDPYMSLTRMRRSLDWAPAPITEEFGYEK